MIGEERLVIASHHTCCFCRRIHFPGCLNFGLNIRMEVYQILKYLQKMLPSLWVFFGLVTLRVLLVYVPLNDLAQNRG